MTSHFAVLARNGRVSSDCGRDVPDGSTSYSDLGGLQRTACYYVQASHLCLSGIWATNSSRILAEPTAGAITLYPRDIGSIKPINQKRMGYSGECTPRTLFVDTQWCRQ